MKLKFIILILLVIIIIKKSYSQKGYLIIDSAMSFGVKIINGSDEENSHLCKVVKAGGEKFEYTPYEVNEYGFKGGPVYISMEVEINNNRKKVFLERLVKGRLSLYYFKEEGERYFYLKKDSSNFLKLNKEIFKNQLQEILSDSPEISQSAIYSTYRKPSLKALIKNYNKGNGQSLPYFKFGLIAGFENKKLKPYSDNLDEHYNNFYFRNNYSYQIGLFIDQPLFTGGLSFHADIFFSNHSYYYYYQAQDYDLDFFTNLPTLSCPGMIRYTFSESNIKPFFNVGLLANYNFKNSSNLYMAKIDNESININRIDKSELISMFQTGYIIGGGAELTLSKKNNIAIEIRHSYAHSLDFNGPMALVTTQLLASVSFR